MKRTVPVVISVFGALALAPVLFVRPARAETAVPPGDTGTVSVNQSTLQLQIQEKAKQLTAINEQLASTTASLNNTKQQRQTLQGQLNALNGNIKTLNLGIQADTLTAQQLGLEIQSLGFDLQYIAGEISLKQSAIGAALKEVQKNDTEKGNMLALLLKSGSLADGVLEANSLQNLQSQLAVDIDGLKNLHDQYTGKLQESSAKKNQVAMHQEDLRNKKAIVQDQTAEKQTLLVTTKNQEGVYQKQLAALEEQQQQIASDIEALDAVLRLKIDPATLPPFQAGILAVPVMGGTKASVTQGYGATSFAKNGYRGRWHNGIDFSASIGTPILAAEDGAVAGAGNQDAYCPRGAYGRFIAINHNDGLTSLYGHLSRILVSKGDIVKRGQVIGYSGRSGYATGPHLHFTVYAQATFYMGSSRTCGPMPYGGDLNPTGYLF